jgi:hypothetical protein
MMPTLGCRLFRKDHARKDHARSDGVERLGNMFSFTPKETPTAYEERGLNHDQADD